LPKETHGGRARRSARAATKTSPEAKPLSKAEPPETKPAAAPLPEIKPAAEIPPKPEAKPMPGGKAKTKTTLLAKPAPPPATPPPTPPKPPAIAAAPAPEPEPKMEKPTPPAPEPISRSVRPARKAPARIPPILFEGDKPGPASLSGPGHRYALGPTPPIENLPTEGELPTSYGTENLLLTARDPHWLYAHWDLSDAQQRRYNAWSRDGHLVVRVYIEAIRGRPATEIHVHPESRHWFVHVERANTRYIAELGYYSAADKWTSIATSTATLTPPDAVSTDTSAEFTAIPVEVPMEKLLSLVKEAVHENAPLAQALHELRHNGHAGLPPVAAPQPGASISSLPQSIRPRTANGLKPPVSSWTPSKWTPAQERALAEVISMDHVRRVWMGSLEITELIRRQWLKEHAPGGAGELGAFPSAAPTSPAEAFAITGISSPAGQAAEQRRQKSFWFNVNAELIVYGATEPDATVTIAGRKIKLRPDGSFSYRFALPDGNYEMPAIAISADQTDGRAADLKFSRNTEYRGDVAAHPQDPSLRPMAAENF